MTVVSETLVQGYPREMTTERRPEGTPYAAPFLHYSTFAPAFPPGAPVRYITKVTVFSVPIKPPYEAGPVPGSLW